MGSVPIVGNTFPATLKTANRVATVNTLLFRFLKWMTNNFMPTVKECIEYIVGCGFTFTGRVQRRFPRGGPIFYRFTKNSGTMPNGSTEVLFNIAELRHAKKFGW